MSTPVIPRSYPSRARKRPSYLADYETKWTLLNVLVHTRIELYYVIQHTGKPALLFDEAKLDCTPTVKMGHEKRQSPNMQRMRHHKLEKREDYPYEIERRRKQLWPYLRAARAGDPNHHENRVTAHLRVDKLIINCQAFSVDNVDKVPDFVRSAVDEEPKRKIKRPPYRLMS
ncbi:hypothetical protein LSH36_436g01022 [Paralvinella palmiformis]|uniref:Uncharacterized protein n=1 Tax=Paralvinella palmiformis TaxID=53620 RepID=A0AAD9JCA0_9ANNE|nr:hypothetical protein LSH36_436g01022 [Paralvinella palmiformis]